MPDLEFFDSALAENNLTSMLGHCIKQNVPRLRENSGDFLE